MAKFQSPLLGYNNNVRHKNRVFHIQTEDSGVNHPHIITHLFMDGGRILKSVKKSYAEHVGADGMNETVRVLMKEQHKAMFIALRDGQFDYLVDGGPAPVAAAGAAAAAPAAAAAAAASEATTAPELAAVDAEVVESPLVAAAPAPPAGPASAPPTTPDPPRSDIELTPAKPPSGRELTLDFDALERSAQDAVSPSLFHTTDLPPPPKNLFAREPGTGGVYRAVETHPRSDTRDETSARADLREEPDTRGAAPPPGPPPSQRGDKSPQPSRASSRAPAGRTGDVRYAPARPAAIFGSTGSTPRQPPQSLFSDELVSDKSLDEVILSYLAEDLEPPRRK